MNIESLVRENVIIPIGDLFLEGILTIPEEAKGLIIFVHGSGSSRLSSRNTKVAEDLNQGGFATLLFDLLTIEEDQDRANRFDIKLLTERLIIVTGWVMGREDASGLPIGYFGASTGAAAALIASTRLGHTVKALVSRGGRPDMAMSVVEKVSTPVMLIVGGLDEQVISLNLNVYSKLNTNKEIRIIPDSGHLFEEPGKLEVVSKIALEWFDRYVKKNDK